MSKLKVFREDDTMPEGVEMIAEEAAVVLTTPSGQTFSFCYDDETGGLLVCTDNLTAASMIQAGEFQGLILTEVVPGATVRTLN